MYFKFQQHFQAEDGSHGSSSNKSGRAGKDLILRVPCGTAVQHATSRLRIRDLSKEGDRVLVVKGGKGGVGNHTGKPALPGGSPITFKVELFLFGVLLMFGNYDRPGVIGDVGLVLG